MKTKKIMKTKIVQREVKEDIEEEVIDREHYIEKVREQEKKRGQLTIEIQGGVLVGVYNIPGETYTLIDWDDLREQSEEEFEEWVKHFEDEKDDSS